MNPDAMPKVFDITQPKPSPSGRPIIVGHQPTLVDPMVRRPIAPAAATSAQPSAPPQPSAQAVSITVSDGQPVEPAHEPEAPFQPTGEASINVSPQSDVEAPMPQPMPTPMPPVAEAPVMPQPIEAPMVVQTPTPATPHPEPAPTPQHHPVPGAQHAHKPRALSHIIVWLIVILLLGAVAAYLLIDAGVIHSNFNLPVHIFSN